MLKILLIKTFCSLSMWVGALINLLAKLVTKIVINDVGKQLVISYHCNFYRGLAGWE